ncbi:MAG: trypsin-like serine protease [Alphaproteobacteria bacterium]
MRVVGCKAKLVIFVSLCIKLTAMVGSGTIQEHQKLVYEAPYHEAAALITDNDIGFTQSGVLVRKNIVLTAAHGMQLLLNAKYPIKDLGNYVLVTPKKLSVTFSITPNTHVTYKVEKVLLDSRYVRFEVGDQHKYDIALLKLSEEVESITPVPIANEIALETDVPMLVQTWGNADVPRQQIKRGFYLFEWSLFFPNKDEDPLANLRTVMLGSIFFEPSDVVPNKPNINDPESTQRRYFAIKSWLKHKRPYGLALPGTSGAPVYVETTINGKTSLSFFGLVMGYASIGEENLLIYKKLEDLSKNPNDAYNVQTIITTPFRLNMQPTANTTDKKHFTLDKRYLRMIDGLSNGSIS